MIKDFLCKHGDYRSDRSFKELTTIKMGGEIAHYVEPYNLDDLKQIVGFLKVNHIPFKTLGNGSNLICGSSRFEGVVISMRHFDNYEISNNTVYVEAGVLAPYFVQKTVKNGLTGMEFAGGIPGTIGGLIYMNAGAYKKEMADIVREVLVLKDGEIIRMKKDELKYRYRYSIFQEHPHWFIVAAYLDLESGDAEESRSIIEDRARRRRESQPIDMPSAGSCFRNPEGEFAWKLIDGIGYRGRRLNGVEVSSKHSNFLVNSGEGRGEDYLELALDIQDKVKEKYDIRLIMEVEKFNC
ncbi:MAG: UDP-N-acetylmuramate dehydrogenase [Erysipelotrichaceae bacterium]|nr:UDP-N-acetylmuramate dehydrogenase [Erysipelotrichaceae bacterium]